MKVPRKLDLPSDIASSSPIKIGKKFSTLRKEITTSTTPIKRTAQNAVRTMYAAKADQSLASALKLRCCVLAAQKKTIAGTANKLKN